MVGVIHVTKGAVRSRECPRHSSIALKFYTNISSIDDIL